MAKGQKILIHFYLFRLIFQIFSQCVVINIRITCHFPYFSYFLLLLVNDLLSFILESLQFCDLELDYNLWK